jgi:hypothetical protein
VYSLDTCILLPSTLAITKKLPNLVSLFIRFDDEAYFTWEDDRSFFLSVSGFSSLTSLEIYGLYGPLYRYAHDVVMVIIASPGLRNLGLSISSHTIDYGNYEDEEEVEDEDEPEVLAEEVPWDPVDGFWESVCSKYGLLTNVRLPIESLKLGSGMYIRSSTDNVNMLSQMLNLENLKSLVYNNRSGNCTGWVQLDNVASLSSITIPNLDYAFLDFLENRVAPLPELNIVEKATSGELNRLFKILANTGIEKLSLGEESISLKKPERTTLVECKTLQHLEISFEYDEEKVGFTPAPMLRE